MRRKTDCGRIFRSDVYSADQPLGPRDTGDFHLCVSRVVLHIAVSSASRVRSVISFWAAAFPSSRVACLAFRHDFEVFSQRYERGSILVTTNLPFDEWTEVFGSERLTGALLDRLTHHVHILEMNGESYRLKRSRENAGSPASEEPDDV